MRHGKELLPYNRFNLPVFAAVIAEFLSVIMTSWAGAHEAQLQCFSERKNLDDLDFRLRVGDPSPVHSYSYFTHVLN